MKTKLVLASSISGLFALAAMSGAVAADSGKKDMEKCYGVVKAGKNDCAAKGHSCMGQAKTDGASGEWIFLPKGTCERIAGGSLKPKM